MTPPGRFTLLFEEAHAPLMRYLARRAPADTLDDLFAEVMAVAWRRLDDVPDGAEVPWLLGVARRVLANQRRAEVRISRLREPLGGAARAAAQPTWAPEPAGGVAEAMGRLPAADAEVLRLWAWDGLAPREIAAVLGITPNSASVRLHRAKARLRAEVEAGGKDPAAAGQSGGVTPSEAPR